MSTNLRIIHCLRAPVGGLFRHVRDLSAEQARCGHRIGVICDTRAGDDLTEARLDQLSRHLSLGLLRAPMSRNVGLSDVTAYRATREFLRSSNADIIHGHGAKGGAYARLSAQGLRRAGADIACFYTPHGGSLHYHPSSPVGRVYMAAERFMARHTDGILFESAYSAGVYARQVGAPSCRTSIVPNGLLPEEFTPYAPARDATDFLFVGELRHLKGVDLLLQALKTVREMHAARATIVGAGPDAAQLHDLAKSLELNDCVRFTGALPAREAFPMGRALVMPSRVESFPYIVLEAAAAALPLLASNVGGIPEIVAETDTQLLPAGDADALAAAMADFLTAPEAAIARAERLQTRVAGTFTVAAMSRAVNNVYTLR